MDSTLLSQYALIDTAVLILVPLALIVFARQSVAILDSKGMFHVPFCRSLAIGTGVLAGCFFLFCSDFTSTLSLRQVWQLNGPWHDGFAVLLARHLNAFAWPEFAALGHGSLPWSDYFVAMLVVSIAAISLLSAAIAVLAWRSFGAWRGIAGHLIISAATACIAVLTAIALFWTLHWLNFWLFLVLFIVIEMRRREDTKVTRLSF